MGRLVPQQAGVSEEERVRRREGLMKKFLLKVKFRQDASPVYLTEASEPFVVEEVHLDEYVGYLRTGEGFLGDLFEVYGNRWHVEGIWSVELGEEVAR